MLARIIVLLLFVTFSAAGLAEVQKFTMGDILAENHCTVGNNTLKPSDVDYTGFSEGEIRLYLGSFAEHTGLYVRRYVSIRINKTVDNKGPYYYLHLKMYHNNAPIMPAEFETRYTPAAIEGSDAYLVEFLKSPCSNLYRKKMKLIDELREMGADQMIIDDYNKRPWESCDDLAEQHLLTRSLDNMEIKVSAKEHPLTKDISPLQLRCNFLNF
jgi:hypothetical protein